jgi:hypothetical protein
MLRENKPIAIKPGVSMKENYENVGIDEYYIQHGTSYRNPHFYAIQNGCGMLLNELFGQYWVEDGLHPTIKLLDLAAGSGEATLAIHHWVQKQSARIAEGHEPSVCNGRAIARPSVLVPSKPILPSKQFQLIGCDPYTQSAFQARIGKPCYPWSFQTFANGDISITFDIVICSFALHLLNSSQLFTTLYALASQARYLLVLSPHKKPTIENRMGWSLLKEIRTGDVGNAVGGCNRVHGRLFESLLFNSTEDSNLEDVTFFEIAAETKFNY